jgi:hypothetical protein
MANITLTEVDVAIPEFWSATALGALKANTVAAQLVRRDFDNQVATQGDTVNVIRRGALSVNSKVANTAVTLQNPTNTNIPVVLDQHKEVSMLIEDIASAKAIENALDYVEDAAIVMSEDVDVQLLNLFSTVPQFVGAYADDLDVPALVGARKGLNDLKCPQRGRVMVIGSGPEASLLSKIEFTSTDFGGDSSRVAIMEANLGRRWGFDYFMDQQVVESPAATNVNNLAFHRDAFVLVSRTLPLPPTGVGAMASTVSEDGVGMRAIRAYNADHLGVQMTIDILFGVKELRQDTHAVVVRSSDATA